MSRWPIKPLGEVAEFINGRAFKPSEWSETGVPIIRIQNLTNPDAVANRFQGVLDEKHSIRDGDLLVSWSATLDVFEWDRGAAALNQHIFKVIPRLDLVNKRYLYYALKSAMDEMRLKTHGATMKHITKGLFEATEIPIPPLPDQERIVRLLDEADTIRKLRAEADQRIAEFIPALFHQMFGDPATNPMGWPVKRVEELTLSCDYGTSQKADENGLGVPVLRMGNVTTSGDLHLSSLKYVQLGKDELQKYALQAGDILFNRTNSRDLVGKTGMWDGRFEAVAASYFIRLRLLTDLELPQHFVTFMNLPSTKSSLARMARGAIGQANINSRELGSIKLPVPPVEHQLLFAARLSEMRSIAYQQGESLAAAHNLMHSMVDRAFGGLQ